MRRFFVAFPFVVGVWLFLLPRLQGEQISTGDPNPATRESKSESTGVPQAEAIAVLRQKVAAAELKDGIASLLADRARFDLFRALMAAGELADAREVMERTLEFRKVALGPTEQHVAEPLTRIADTYRISGDNAAAVRYYQEAETLLAATTNPNPEICANNWNGHALSLQEQGSWRGAEELWTYAVDAKVKAGEMDAQLGLLLSNRAEVRRGLGQFREAGGDLDQAIKLLGKLPAGNPLLLLAGIHRACLIRDEGDIIRAIAIFEECIPPLASKFSPVAPEVISAKRELAKAWTMAGEYRKAFEVIDDALESLRKSNGTFSRIRFALVTDHADRLADLGNYLQAQEEYNSALATIPDNEPLVWAARERLAMVKLGLSDYEGARSLVGSVLDYRRKEASKGPRLQEDLASSLLEACRFERKMGRDDDAAVRLKEMADVLRASNSLERQLAAEMWNEAAVQAQEHNHDGAALTNYLRAISIYRRIGASNTILAAQCEMNIAQLLAKTGSLDDAIKVAKSRMEWLTDHAPPRNPVRLTSEFIFGGILHRAGRLDEAAVHYQTALSGAQSAGVGFAAVVARDYTFLEHQRGHPSAALDLALGAAKSVFSEWQNILRFAPERDRLAWQAHHDVFSALVQVADADALPLADAVLRFKGAVLDSIIEDRQLTAARNEPVAANLIAARSNYFRITVTAKGAKQADDARRELDRIEGAAAEKVASLGIIRDSIRAESSKVRAVLATNTVLIEFIRYRRPVPVGQSEDRYGAIILPSFADTRSKIGWIDIDDAKTIDGAVSAWQTVVHQSLPPMGSNVTDPLNRLFALIWNRLEPALPPDASTVIVAPDGGLNFVPFAALWDGAEFLGEKKLFRYVASGRDLLAPPYRPPAQKYAVIVSDVDYGPFSVPVRPKASDTGDWFDKAGIDAISHYPSTHGTAAQGIAIAKLLEAAHCKPSVMLSGKAAQEERLKTYSSPFVIHFATHGDVLADWRQSWATWRTSPRSSPLVRDPMMRSWVALSGANVTLASWKGGIAPDPNNDGILTAADASLLPLTGTWLVTLSACDTGLGPDQGGEGVFGLRRGFTSAGARSCLLTLWRVWGNRSGKFMEDFYREALETGDAPGSLARTQRRWLQSVRQNSGPDQAALDAGPFILSSRGW